ncbi:putative tannase subunit protein [Neofusicoccum parvum]|uniref:Tannase subunit protein n=1 Tax=Neofusicoccum parvum TaxID=310453 RepID=A0ACB5RN25_9PEZI|nr:putative tannase subunit protein [Neofusicoccum parvum]
MRSARTSMGLAAAAALRATAASLADVCTTSHIQSALPVDAVEGITLEADSVTSNAVYNYSVSSGDLWPGKSGLNFCNVTFAYTRNGEENSTTNVWYWLPAPDQFQNRYLTTGGGGFSITSGEQGLGNGLVYGAVAGTTDGGFGSWSNELSDVILKANGTMDYDMLFNFGYRSIHEMSVIGKELTKSFYGGSNIYSYYQGCSEGGREGWSQVQRYGSQFDGAAIGAPAFRQAFQQVAHLFSAVVETTNDYYPSSCELEKINNDTITACDELDGRKDGVVSRTDLCKLHYSSNSSVGEHFACAASSGGGSPMRKRQMGGGSASPAVNGTVSDQAAEVAEDIIKGLFDSKGRQAYISYQPAAGFSDAATTYNSATGKYEATASGIGLQWVNYFLKKIISTELSLDNVTYDTLRDWMVQGMQEYADTMQTTWPDLTDFKEAGGKVIHFHGESDNSIPTGSSVIYQEAVRKIMYPGLGYNESYAQLNDWYRLFLVPGAAHCGVNSEQPNGPFPQNVLASVIDWVENGVNPERLNATVIDGDVPDKDQKICSFPLRPLWKGNSTMDCVYDQESIDSWLPNLNAIPAPVY